MPNNEKEPSGSGASALTFGEVYAITTRAAQLIRQGHRPKIAAEAALALIEQSCLCTACGQLVHIPGTCPGEGTCAHCNSQVMHRGPCPLAKRETAS